MRATCSVPDCECEIAVRGLCSKHYQRSRRAGKVTGMTRTERTLAFIERCLIEETEECILPDFKERSEYPTIRLNGIEQKIAAVVLVRSGIERPNGLELRHLCGNRRCCNRKHLKWGTHLENMDDWKRHGCAGDRSGINNPNYRHGLYCS